MLYCTRWYAPTLACCFYAHTVHRYTHMLAQDRVVSCEVITVPKGVLVVAFDNEQRLLKNYLSRGTNRSQLYVLTNICCSVIDEESDL